MCIIGRYMSQSSVSFIRNLSFSSSFRLWLYSLLTAAAAAVVVVHGRRLLQFVLAHRFRGENIVQFASAVHYWCWSWSWWWCWCSCVVCLRIIGLGIGITRLQKFVFQTLQRPTRPFRQFPIILRTDPRQMPSSVDGRVFVNMCNSILHVIRGQTGVTDARVVDDGVLAQQIVRLPTFLVTREIQPQKQRSKQNIYVNIGIIFKITIYLSNK